MFNPNNRRLFDTHCHIGEFGKWRMRQHEVAPFVGREISSAEDMKKYMEEKGIAKAIVMPHYAPDQNYAFDNNAIVKQAITLPKVYGALWVSPLPENKQKTLRVLEELPIKDIVALKMSPTSWPGKFYTPDPKTWDRKFSETMEKIIEKTKEQELVLQIHTGNGNADIRQFVPFVEKYGKEVKIHFVHMGGSSGGHFGFVPQFIEWVKSGYKVYCDTSSARGFGPAWLVKELQQHCSEGLNKVFFASDNPWGLFESEFWKIEGMQCSEKIKEKIFFGNAEEVYTR